MIINQWCSNEQVSPSEFNNEFTSLLIECSDKRQHLSTYSHYSTHWTQESMFTVSWLLVIAVFSYAHKARTNEAKSVSSITTNTELDVESLASICTNISGTELEIFRGGYCINCLCMDHTLDYKWDFIASLKTNTGYYFIFNFF